MNKYIFAAKRHAGKNPERYVRMDAANNQDPEAARFVTNNYWLVVKQQYNAAKNSWKTFPEYEAKLRTILNETLGSIIYEDDYAFVFNGKEPCFTNISRRGTRPRSKIGRRVEVFRCFSAGDTPPTLLFTRVPD